MKITLLMAALLATSVAHADVVTAKGKASVKYTEKTANADAKERAVFAAQMKAIEMYFAEAGDAQAENLDAIRETIRKDPERFILESTTLQEDDRADLHQYTAVVRVSLNGSNLRNALKKASPVGAAGEHSQLAFVLVSRQVDAQTSFDARVTQRAVVTSTGKGSAARSERGSEGEAISGNKVSTNASKNVKANYAVERGVTVETGGSTVQRADQSTWKLMPSQNLNSVITQIFRTSGYRVVDATFVEPMTNGKFKVADVENDYRSGNDLKSGTLATVVNGMRIAKVRYVALGTLDVGTVGTDPSTGLMRVAVTANAKVLDLGQAIPETVAVAGPAQYAGTGPTEDEARTNALKIAAQTVSRELTSQLANAGLR